MRYIVSVDFHVRAKDEDVALDLVLKAVPGIDEVRTTRVSVERFAVVPEDLDDRAIVYDE
jgi:hypothetical protein